MISNKVRCIIYLISILIIGLALSIYHLISIYTDKAGNKGLLASGLKMQIQLQQTPQRKQVDIIYQEQIIALKKDDGLARKKQKTKSRKKKKQSQMKKLRKNKRRITKKMLPHKNKLLIKGELAKPHYNMPIKLTAIFNGI